MAEPSASAGAKFFICATPTAATTAAAYAALTWVELGLTESVSEFGDTAASITWTGLGDNRVRKIKGANDAGDVTVVCALESLDPGQIAANAARKSKFNYPIKVLCEDSTVENDTDSTFYFQAKVMSNKITVGSNNDVLKRNYVFAIDSDIVDPSED